MWELVTRLFRGTCRAILRYCGVEVYCISGDGQCGGEKGLGGGRAGEVEPIPVEHTESIERGDREGGAAVRWSLSVWGWGAAAEIGGTWGAGENNLHGNGQEIPTLMMGETLLGKGGAL